jgi:hypothetical protein
MFGHKKHVMLINMMIFDEANEGHKEVAYGLFYKLLEEKKKRGFVCYRTHPNYISS